MAENNSLKNMANMQNTSSIAQGNYSDVALRGAKNAVSQHMPKDGFYGDAANVAFNNVKVDSNGISLDYTGMATDMLSSNKYTKGISDAINSPVGQCAVGAAEVYAGFYSGNPQMMLDGATKIYDNYEGAIDQVKNSNVGQAIDKGIDKFCDGLDKLGKASKSCISSIKNALDNKLNFENPLKKRGGSCSGNSSSDSSSSCNNPIGEQTPEEAPKTPRFKLKIDENDIPENWWDKIPDFDPRVYDAISMEQAASCVEYIFDGLPEIHDLEHQIEARKFRKICPRLKTQVPRTKVQKPREIKYDTKIDAFIKDDVAY